MKIEHFSPLSKEKKKEKITKTEKEREMKQTYEDIKQFAASAEKYIDREIRNFLPEAEQRIESWVKSMNISPEMLSDLRQEQELDKKLNEVQKEANQLASEEVMKIREILGSEELEVVEKKLEFLFQEEMKYFQEFKVKRGDKTAEELWERYEAGETKAEYVLNQLKEFSKRNGAEYKSMPEAMKDMPYNSETKKVILQIVQEQINALLFSKDKTRGRFQERKRESVFNEVKRYADLIEEAQAEGDIDIKVPAEAVLQILQENVAALAFQDEAAAENTLGDHGIRHIVDHNIKVAENVLTEIEKQGGYVRAIDRIMVHQIMIWHDFGYAMDPVRESIIKFGLKGQDLGHNLLAAKVIRERMGNSDDKLNSLFNPDQINIIHVGVLKHDDSMVDIRFDNSLESRRLNVESAIHIADNTHAFEDKLPEILYSIPETLKIMRLLKVAGEIEDKETMERLKNNLISVINSKEDFTNNDKRALIMAVRSLRPESYKFLVGRICGNKPEVFIEENGRVVILVEESAIHQETIKLFEQKAYDQLHKFVADLTGRKKEEVAQEMNSDTEEIVSERIKILLKIGEKKSYEKSDYQRNIEELISDFGFREFCEKDNELLKKQKVFEALENQEEVERIKNQRRNLLSQYIEKYLK